MSTLTTAGFRQPMGNGASHHHAVGSIQPIHRNLKTISHTDFKPHVPPIRNQYMRNSGNNIVLPKLTGRNHSQVQRTDLLSPIRHNQGAQSVRNRNGPAKILTEAKLIQMRPPIPTMPPNHAMKNFTALELSRFIDKRLTDVTKSNIKYLRAQRGDMNDFEHITDDQ